MHKEIFLDLTREYFRQMGFNVSKRSKFFFESVDIVLQVWMNKSQFSKMYYIDYYIRIKAFHPEVEDVTNDLIWDTHFSRLTDGDGAFVIMYEEVEPQEYLKELKQHTEEQLVPILTGGNDFLKKVAQTPQQFPNLYIFFTDEATKMLVQI